MIVGSHLEFLWTRAVIFIVSNMSSPLLLAGPTGPSPTGTPASHLSGVGAVPPLPPFQSEKGDSEPLTPFLPNNLNWLLVSQQHCRSEDHLLRNQSLPAHS